MKTTPQPESGGLLTYGQAATFLRISLRQFRRLVDGGSIPFVQVSERAPRVQLSDIQKFVAAATVQRSTHSAT